MNTNTKAQLEMINQQIKELVGIYRSAYNTTDISDNEFWIWYALIVMDGDFTQQDICSTWTFSKQTVNTIITNMVKKGYATLEVVPGTKNRKLIRLTDAGQKYGESVVLPVFEAEQRAFAKLSEDDQLAFGKFLGSYIHNLKEEFHAK